MKSWRALSVAAENKLPVPDAGVGPDGQLLYTWNTNEMWGYDYKVGNMVPHEVINRMKPFL
jgi:hypothetical protein